jgi:hypothetical protein
MEDFFSSLTTLFISSLSLIQEKFGRCKVNGRRLICCVKKRSWFWTVRYKQLKITRHGIEGNFGWMATVMECK